MSKLALVAINSSWSHSNLALYYLRTQLETLPYTTHILSYTLKDDPLQPVEELICQDFQIACFSAYIWNKAYLFSLLSTLLQVSPQMKVVLGGAEAAYLYADLMAELPTLAPGRLLLIEGPGELAFKELAASHFVSPTPIIPSQSLPLSEIPFPYKLSDKAALGGKLVYYESSRGCPYRCVYCLSATDYRNEKRFDTTDPASLRQLYSELDLLFALEPKTLKFVDRSFNTDKALAHKIWSYVIEREDAPICHFEIYPDLLTDEDITLLSRAPSGRIRFEIGIQSTNPQTLAASGRKMDWIYSRRMLQRLKSETGILMHSDLLIGLPGDGMDSVLNSLNELMRLEPHELQLGMLKILPDTPMREIAQKLGYIWQKAAPYRVLASDALSFVEICRLDHLAHLINLYWNKAELQELCRPILQDMPAAGFFLRLLDYHKIQDLPFHSLSPARRKESLASCFGISPPAHT